MRRPTLDEATEYLERRMRAADADGNRSASSAYAIAIDYLRNARFDVTTDESTWMQRHERAVAVSREEHDGDYAAEARVRTSQRDALRAVVEHQRTKIDELTERVAMAHKIVNALLETSCCPGCSREGERQEDWGVYRSASSAYAIAIDYLRNARFDVTTDESTHTGTFKIGDRVKVLDRPDELYGTIEAMNINSRIKYDVEFYVDGCRVVLAYRFDELEMAPPWMQRRD